MGVTPADGRQLHRAYSQMGRVGHTLLLSAYGGSHGCRTNTILSTNAAI